MDPDQTEIAPVSDAPQAQNTEPERKAELAQPDEATQEDQSKESDEGEKLTDEQKTIRKLQRRIERLSAKVGGTSRERDLYREQLAQLAPQADETESAEPDIERVATEKARQIVHQQQLETKAQDVVKTGKKLEGFDQAVATLRDEVPFVDSRGRFTPFFTAVLESDMAAQVMHYLGNNPDEASEFEGLSQTQIGRRLAKLEDKLGHDAKAKTSKAPSPIEPIGRGGSPAVVDLTSASQSDYEKLRAKQGAMWSNWRR